MSRIGVRALAPVRVPQASYQEEARNHGTQAGRLRSTGARVAECTTHYQRRRWGHATDAPIRRYTHSVRPKRKKPFAADYALLAELGLRRN
jgi:hypothetical protein